MNEITLGYKAFDVHELTCHFVALHAGLYAERGLDVQLLDTRSIPEDELPGSAMSVACGSALLRWLDGERVKVVFVAATRPMFWLYGRKEIEDLRDLAGGRIADYPPAAPPAQFLRIVLEDEGLAGAATLVPARDDAGRQEMLESGAVGAALLSSATPARVAEQAGLRRLLCLGDRIRLPSTGLAVPANMLEGRPDLVNSMCEAFRAALRIVHGNQAALRDALRAAALVDERDLGAACSLVREFYSTDGVPVAPDSLPAVQRLARCAGLTAPVCVDDLYTAMAQDAL